MDVVSLGYRTDLMVRALEGSEVADRGDYITVRTAANPVFWWGNFLLLPAEALSGPPDRWLELFASEFPEAGHVALGISRHRLSQPRRLSTLRRASITAATGQRCRAPSELNDNADPDPLLFEQFRVSDVVAVRGVTAVAGQRCCG
jgi:hypothetical protein